MSLLDIQTDPIYRKLVDEVLDQLRPVIETKDRGMGYRAGWIFVTSPNAITPFHMDQEHNFIMQVMGKKRLYVWDPFDREAVSHEGLERFHAVHSRDLVRFSEGLRIARNGLRPRAGHGRIHAEHEPPPRRKR